MIVELLSELVKQGADELHVKVGQLPLLLKSGRVQKLDTKRLEPADTMGMMKSIMPERCQQEFRDTDNTEFSFDFGGKARLLVSVFRSGANVALIVQQIRASEGRC